MSTSPIIGVAGGGQLGQMLTQAAFPLNIPIVTLDNKDAPAKKINHHDNHVTGSFKDAEKLRELARRCDFLTVEIEHIDAAVLQEIADNGVTLADGSAKSVEVHPAPRTLALIKDKFRQKEYFASKGISVAEQLPISGGADFAMSLADAAEKLGLPLMLKSRNDSYDGRGNLKLDTLDAELVSRELGTENLYAEKMVPFVKELSVMVVRSDVEQQTGGPRVPKTFPYPAVETVHEDSICATTFYPPRGVSKEINEKAQALASKVADQLWGRGVFAVEMFLTSEGKIKVEEAKAHLYQQLTPPTTGNLLVNEVAPRPHNSGHYTIEAIPQMSQYKAQLYAIRGLIPASQKLTPRCASSIMINVLGGAGPASHVPLVSLAETLYNDDMDIHIHMYGKDAKPSRKIGHITLCSNKPIAELEALAQPLIELASKIHAERVEAGSKALRNAAAPAVVPSAAQKQAAAQVLVIMGSDSDMPVLRAGLEILEEFKVPIRVDITSAHRTPGYMAEVVEAAASEGIKVIIGAAGGAAHLPGMAASHTPLPVIGVPVKATHLDGVDSLHSIVQMPRGIPVATVGINNSTNAALLAIRILGAEFPEYRVKMEEYMTGMKDSVKAKSSKVLDIGWRAYLDGMAKK
ncbi:Phosphoribosylaminoimidazole carboxylase [Ceratocystis fimbriata CBS 114723]|uniref:Phosphoribosylaminoimidazole carboxylase n=1 Tax=Ceratocystis fimbriata CBS 114723 TaxID=1035309 RepID=A0A2C5X739_9PEZI|nr:Phosphoribosylaminoimidazole carboxylase [Ceratocystis fimbriata CBS 114723]